ncbi:pentapeptide repeat-containing protein [Lactiplantibacillus fabifermentans]|nr:pentapeptide repeat-containing protein [Lactiplantibacillus fabifermentans]
MNAPKIDPTILPAIDLLTIRTAEDQLLANGAVVQQTVTNLTLTHPLIEQCYFENTILSENDFERLELTDVIFKNCDLSNGNFEQASLYRVQFENCKLVGATFDDGYFKDVSFKNCQLNLANFNATKFPAVTFTDSRLSDVNCMESTLSPVHHLRFK